MFHIRGCFLFFAYILHLLCLRKSLIQASITPFEKHQERNHMVPGWHPRPWAALEPSIFSPGVSQKEIKELEGRLAKLV
jgi:hypothetical protein